MQNLVSYFEKDLELLENRVPRKMFGPKEDEVTGDWVKLDSGELGGLYCSPSVVWVIKLR